MSEHERLENNKEAGKQLVTFLLNHRGVLEASTKDPAIRRILTQAQREPDTAFHQVADLIFLFSEVQSKYNDLMEKVLSYKIDNVNDSQLIRDHLILQKQKELDEKRKKGRKKGDGGK